MLLEELLRTGESLGDEVVLIDGRERVTYQELFAYARKIAGKLARLNVGRGVFAN